MAALLNDCGGVWLIWSLDRGIAAAIVFLCVAGVALLLRRRVSAHLASWMWLLPLVPLVVPLDRWMPGVEVAAAPRPVIERLVGVEAVPGADAVQPSTGGGEDDAPRSTAASTAVIPTMESAARPDIHLPAWLFAGWAAVALALAGRFLWNQIRWRRLVGRMQPDRGSLRRRVVRLARRSGVRGDVRVATTDVVAAPATSGWWRPVILLPRDLVDRLSRSQLDWVFLHELAHIRRFDLAVAALQRAIQIAWWWHPVAWIANAETARHRECACDDAASARLSTGARGPGAKALFEVVAAASGVPTSTPALAMLVDHRSQLRRRMMRLLDGGREVARGTSLLGVVGLVVTAAAALTVANAQHPAMIAQETAGRIVQESVPTDPVERAKEAMRRAVGWLVKHQRDDGRWRVGKGNGGRPYAGMETEVSTASRAILALNEADSMVGTEASRAARAKAVAWVESTQDAEGCFGPRKGSAFLYGHALAMIALCGEETRAKAEGRLAKIEKGVMFTLKAQNPYSGWRYGVRDGDNDSKMTTLMMTGLRAARKLGVKVPEQSFQMGEDYIQSMIDREKGRIGWVKSGGLVGRLAETWKTHPAEKSEEVTALVLVDWLDRGKNPARDEVARKGISLVFEKLPEWTVRGGTIDYAYWYWGSRLFHRLGGWQRKAWVESYLEEVVPRTQWLPDGTATWPLDGAWCLPGLEAYVTAVQIRTLVHVLGK